jgi:hypothetical protein
MGFFDSIASLVSFGSPVDAEAPPKDDESKSEEDESEDTEEKKDDAGDDEEKEDGKDGDKEEEEEEEEEDDEPEDLKPKIEEGECFFSQCPTRYRGWIVTCLGLWKLMGSPRMRQFCRMPSAQEALRCLRRSCRRSDRKGRQAQGRLR